MNQFEKEAWEGFFSSPLPTADRQKAANYRIEDLRSVIGAITATRLNMIQTGRTANLEFVDRELATFRQELDQLLWTVETTKPDSSRLPVLPKLRKWVAKMGSPGKSSPAAETFNPDLFPPDITLSPFCDTYVLGDIREADPLRLAGNRFDLNFN